MANRKLSDLQELLVIANDDILYVVDKSDTTESPEGTSKFIKKVNLTSSNISVLDDEYEYLSGTPDFTLPVGAKVSAVSCNGVILRRADWVLTSNTLSIQFTPSSNDIFQPIGIII